jgi:hypothetical protein
MVFALGNLYSLKRWSLLGALRTRAIQLAYATCAPSLQTKTQLWSLKGNISDGCPAFVPSLPGRFFLNFEGAGIPAPCCSPSNDNAVPNDHRFRAGKEVRDSAAPLPHQAPNRKGQHHVSCAEGRDSDRRDLACSGTASCKEAFPEEHWTHNKFVSKEPLLIASIYATRSPAKSMPRPNS